MGSREPGKLVLTARWVLPVDGPSLRGGVVTVAGDRIRAVGPRGSAQADVDAGDAVIVPGFVNAHTHLDLGGLVGRVRPEPHFVRWLRAVVEHRRGQMLDQVVEDVTAGIGECLSCGTTLVGDIAAGGQSWASLAASPLRAVVFYELLGLTKPRARAAWAAARAWLAAHPAAATCRAGLSPHAPYSVRASLFRAAARFARKECLPVATHLAETLAERELLERKDGPFRMFLEALGAWDPEGLVASAGEVMKAFRGTGPTLFIHGNYLPLPPELPPGASVVYCPRTHAAFGHGKYPLGTLLAAGVPVALGTDSLASNPDLDLRAEAASVRRLHPAVSGTRLLRMATLTGAEALGWGTETGSLTPGKLADLVVLGVPPLDPADPRELVWDQRSAVRAVMIGGRWVYGAPAA